MQQLTIEHKKIVENNKKDRRESKGRVLAISRQVYRILNSDTYYVESESTDDLYYFVRFNPSVFEWCSCPDNSTRHVKCKHIFAIEFAIKWGTLKDIDKLPAEAKRYSGSTVTQQQQEAAKSYRDDNYDF